MNYNKIKFLSIVVLTLVTGILFAQNGGAFIYQPEYTSKNAPTFSAGQYVRVEQSGFDLYINGYKVPYLGNNIWGSKESKYIKISDNEFQVERTVTKSELHSGSYTDYYRDVTHSSKGYLLRSNDGSKRR